MKYAILIPLILIVCAGKGQPLKIQTLSEEDARNGVEKKYLWQETHAYGVVQLILFKNHRFKFLVDKFTGTEFGEGNWKVDKAVIILNTDVKKDDVPIEVVCNNDIAGSVDNFKVSIPKDIKGIDLFDCMVRVNNDSTTCLPSYGRCDGNYTFIDSVKVGFGNGMSSKWVSLVGQIFNSN